MTAQGQQHTAEFLYSNIDNGVIRVFSALPGVRLICTLTGNDPVDKANARRLAACWNACSDLSTESLESGVVGKLLEACNFGKGHALNPLIAAANLLRTTVPQLSTALREKRRLEKEAIAQAEAK